MENRYSVAFARTELKRKRFDLSSIVVKKGLVSIIPDGDIMIFVYNNIKDRDDVYKECQATVKFLAKFISS